MGYLLACQSSDLTGKRARGKLRTRRWLVPSASMVHATSRGGRLRYCRSAWHLLGTSPGWDDAEMEIEALDLLYVPSRDVAADMRFYRDALGGHVVFAIEAMGTRVAEVALAPVGPRIVLAGHLPGDAPILLHRVADLDQSLDELGRRGLRLDGRVELPMGPCATFHSPGGQRIALYELTRPHVDERFAGRADFG
jgi:hypothetical protein